MVIEGPGMGCIDGATFVVTEFCPVEESATPAWSVLLIFAVLVAFSATGLLVAFWPRRKTTKNIITMTMAVIPIMT